MLDFGAFLPLPGGCASRLSQWNQKRGHCCSTTAIIYLVCRSHVMGWYGRLPCTKACFRTYTYYFQVLFFSYTIEIRASDGDTFYSKLAKYSRCHFCLFLALTTTLREGPQIKLITRINFGRWCFLKTPANLLQPIS